MTTADADNKAKLLFNSLKQYAENEHSDEIKAILLAEDCMQYYTIAVNAMSLLECNIDFAYFLFNQPEYGLKILKEAFSEAVDDAMTKDVDGNILVNRECINARLVALPSCPELYRTILPRCNDVGKFLCVTGTIVRVTVTKMLEFRKKWKCNKCKFEFTKDVEVEQGFEIVKPTTCENAEHCDSKNFTLVSNGIKSSWCKDYQEVRIQEQVHHLVVGTVPRSMWIILMDDLVDSCQPGNDVIVSGIVRTRWQPLNQGSRSEIELVIVAHNVEVKNNNVTLGNVSDNSLQEFSEFWQKHQSDPLAGRDFILSCLCPQVFGLYIVKLAVALVLAGGVQRVDQNGKNRGDTHLLLVGDPGTGKSQFLKYASKISCRSVLTSGVGTTNAGLTAAAIKDGGKWQLEAGALVLADGGICCIDEFSNIKEQDKASIHEAMEQQTVSVAKAGLVCKLSTQCSILAATNPKGKYNKFESLSVNTAMASPLLSRFDIILVLLDTHSESWDKLVSSYILEGKDMVYENTGSLAWSMEKMRTYFSAIKTLTPRMNSDCDRILQAYYKKQRSCMDRSASRTTPRLLQSLVRLAQGHARLMYRNEATAMDALVAVIVLESSMVGCGLFHDNDALHSIFPDDPQQLYMKQAQDVLNMLGLNSLLNDESLLLAVNSESSRDKNMHNGLVDINNEKTYDKPHREEKSEKHVKKNLSLSANSHIKSALHKDSYQSTVDGKATNETLHNIIGSNSSLSANSASKYFVERPENRGDIMTKSKAFAASSKRPAHSSLMTVKRNKVVEDCVDDDDAEFLDNLCSLAATNNFKPATQCNKEEKTISHKKADSGRADKPFCKTSIHHTRPRFQSTQICSHKVPTTVPPDRNPDKLEPVLQDDLTTLSELNDIFSTELVDEKLDTQYAAFGLDLFEKFAFKNKPSLQRSKYDVRTNSQSSGPNFKRGREQQNSNSSQTNKYCKDPIVITGEDDNLLEMSFDIDM